MIAQHPVGAGRAADAWIKVSRVQWQLTLQCIRMSIPLARSRLRQACAHR